MTLLAAAGFATALAVGLSGCAPGPGVVATPPPLTPIPSGPAEASVPTSAARPAPTQGGIPPTVVGRATPAQASGPGAAATATPQATAQITITVDGSFDPPQVTINAGDTLRWVNLGRAPQTVTGDPARVQNKANAQLPPDAQPWDSGVLNTGQAFVHRFDTPGDYTYTSLPAEGHGIVGRITVR